MKTLCRRFTRCPKKPAAAVIAGLSSTANVIHQGTMTALKVLEQIDCIREIRSHGQDAMSGCFQRHDNVLKQALLQEGSQ